MNNYEARSKAYFIASLLTEAIAEYMPEMFALAAEKLEIPQSEMDEIRRELKGFVSKNMHDQGLNYRHAAMWKRGKHT
jgi:hypothetical protein